MLSLLEVVVATLFSQGVWFGVLLAVYMLLGFSAMTLLLLHREWEHHQPALAAAHSASSFHRRAQGTSRWPLAGQRTEFASSPAGSGHAGIGGDLFGRLGRIGLQTLALAFLLFFTVPRFRADHLAEFDRQTPARGRVFRIRRAGRNAFPLGRPQRSDAGAVLRLPHRRASALYRRDLPASALLNDYHHGQWQSQERPRTVGGNKLHAAPILPQTGLVRQEIRSRAWIAMNCSSWRRGWEWRAKAILTSSSITSATGCCAWTTSCA